MLDSRSLAANGRQQRAHECLHVAGEISLAFEGRYLPALIRYDCIELSLNHQRQRARSNGKDAKGRRTRRRGDSLLIYPANGVSRIARQDGQNDSSGFDTFRAQREKRRQLPAKRSRYSSAVGGRHVRYELIGTRSDSFRHSLRI